MLKKLGCGVPPSVNFVVPKFLADIDGGGIHTTASYTSRARVFFQLRDDPGILIERLDRVLGELDRGWKYLRDHNQQINEFGVVSRKGNYTELRNVLPEVDGR